VERAEAVLLPPGSDPGVLRAVLRRHLSALLSAQREDAERIFAFASWLVSQDVSGYMLRQVPLRGVDTKWLGRHRAVVEGLVEALRGGEGLGLRVPRERVRLRFLDASLAPAGLDDVELPVPDAASLDVPARAVIVVENLQTFLALPAAEGTVAVFGSGYGAGARLEGMRWMRSARLLYWGDLDSHGLAVLHQFRSRFPLASSVLMDTATLLSHRDLWVTEEKPHRGELGGLTEPESRALAVLRSEGDARLEQERIPWAYAEAALGRELFAPSDAD